MMRKTAHRISTPFKQKPKPKFHMKIKFHHFLFALALLAGLNHAAAQGTAFTYQGQLQNVGSPANGSYDLKFTLFNASIGGSAVGNSQTNNAVPVTNGLFVAQIEFGTYIFTGTSNWLEIAVATNGANIFTALTPRQQLTPTPNAIYAETAGGVPGLTVQNNTNGAPNVIGGSSLNSVAADVVGATIAGGGAVNYQNVAYSNQVTVIFGTVGGGRENIASGDSATVGGGFDNTASSDSTTVSGGFNNKASNGSTTVAGGFDNTASGNVGTVGGGGFNNAAGAYSVVAGGKYNTTTNSYSAVGGGYGNFASNNFATVGGGYENVASGYGAAIGGGGNDGLNTPAPNAAAGKVSFIGGGEANEAGDFSIVGGGDYNSASGPEATVGGGGLNAATNENTFVGGGEGNIAGGAYSTVAGGFGNIANGQGSAIVGGDGNIAAGYASFAAGEEAQALHDSSFVWGDGNGTGNGTGVSASTGASQFDVYAAGGVLLYSDTGINLAGDVSLSGGAAAYHHLSLSGGNSTGYLYGSYPALGDGIHLGYNYYYDSSGAGHVINTGGGTSRISAKYGEIVLAVGGVNAAPNTVRVDATTSGVTVYGTFNNSSDRNVKQDFSAVSPAELLTKVLQLPISEWSYKTDAATRHIGPMGQDFYSTFNIGTDEKHIAPIDEGGVALAAIQGLNQKLEETRAENAQLKHELADIRQMLAQLTQSKN
jgi:trimeric autotransporter adhesin